MYNCRFCNACVADITSHVLRKHKNHPQFSVTCNVCGKTYNKYDSYRKHTLRKHNSVLSEHGMSIDTYNDDDREGVDNSLCPSFTHKQLAENYLNELHHMSAGFLLQMKSMYGTTQAATNFVVNRTEELLDTAIKLLHERLLTKLEASENLADIIQDLDCWKSLSSVKFYDNLNSEWLQLKYFKENFGLIEPTEVYMGDRIITSSTSKSTFNKKVLGYIIPFLPTLKHLLEQPDVFSFLTSNSYRNDDSMGDFKDGTYCKNHDIFKEQSIQILGYYDDIELVNPIGVFTKKHKLSVFQWVLLNIPPKFRSKLSSLQLVAVAKTYDCKEFGLSKLLFDFMNGINHIHNNGITIYCANQELHLKGGLVAFAGDTLASNLIGGFKEGVGFSLKVCRTCEVRKEQLSLLLIEEDCILRDEQEHKRRCSVLKKALTKANRKYWSKMYGINSASCLEDVAGFSVTQCFIHDPMHILFEGVSASELKMLLKYLVIEQKYLNLDQLTDNLTTVLELLPSDKRPNIILMSHLQSEDEKLRQTAHQTWYLCHILPAVVGKYVPENDLKWENFIRLLQIHQLITSPVATEATISCLAILIARHNKAFTEQYFNKTVTPKMHYMVHFPNQIRLFGPARNHSCFRFESKHALFKRSKLRNTKNVAKSLALSHQLWMCAVCHDGSKNKSGILCEQHQVTKPGTVVELLYHNNQNDIIALAQDRNIAANRILQVPEVVVNGVKYCNGDTIMVENYVTREFFILNSLLIIDSSAVCGLADKCVTEYFDSHFNCYVVTRTNIKSFLTIDDLLIPWPVFTRVYNDKLQMWPLSIPDVDEII